MLLYLTITNRNLTHWPHYWGWGNVTTVEVRHDWMQHVRGLPPQGAARTEDVGPDQGRAAPVKLQLRARLLHTPGVAVCGLHPGEVQTVPQEEVSVRTFLDATSLTRQ